MLGDVKGVLGEDSYMGAHQSNSVQSTLFLLVTDEDSKAYGTIWPNKNIARGTTDPEIDSETWTKLGNNMAPLALIENLATRWRHLTFSHLITFSH